MSAVIVYCGSFDPITKSHIAALDGAIDFLETEIEANTPKELGGRGVYRTYLSPIANDYLWKPSASIHDRQRMLELATHESRHKERVMVDTLHSSESGKLSTIYTILEDFRNAFSDKHLYLLCDPDLVRLMCDEKQWPTEFVEKLFGIASLLVAAGNSHPDVRDVVHLGIMINRNPTLAAAHAAKRLWLLPDVTLDDSSDVARQCCREDESEYDGFGTPPKGSPQLRTLVSCLPLTVLTYIKRHHLYGAGGGEEASTA
ncbi:Nicotinamide-nucleotide adenylyltransferase [Giardia muris]|uniref:Nicotinamide-nucleotide adenylyltransferase n=1 Tax=Giardia muris TaxID=5742 RepID=A0A4Z1SKS0_GIAMU|nr:Nicotinamide-nucleotide adenylyltransferase [Giardia muris]|eukprot:TNJ26246.1 Nicotinamide-nucleotide adenylyltransferase [Giardia muris]